MSFGRSKDKSRARGIVPASLRQERIGWTLRVQSPGIHLSVCPALRMPWLIFPKIPVNKTCTPSGIRHERAIPLLTYAPQYRSNFELYSSAAARHCGLENQGSAYRALRALRALRPISPKTTGDKSRCHRHGHGGHRAHNAPLRNHLQELQMRSSSEMETSAPAPTDIHASGASCA